MSHSHKSSVRIVVLASALALAAGATIVAAPVPAVLADAVDDQIKAMKEFDKSGDEGKCITEMQKLADGGNPKALEPIKSLARSSKSDKIRCMAIKKVAMTFHDSKFLPELVKWLDDKDLAKAADKEGRPDVYVAVIDAIGAYKSNSKAAMAALEDVVKKRLGQTKEQEEYAPHAIKAYGTVQEKPVIDTLLEWGELADSHGTGQGGHAESADTRTSKDKSKAAVLLTLAALCGDDYGSDVNSWKKWWEANKKTFTFPKAEEESKVNVSTLTEWTDPAYGYKVVKPKGWIFQPKTEYYRIQCLRKDDKEMWWTYFAWGVWKPNGGNIKDAKTYAEWWVNEQFPKEEFEEFSPASEKHPEGGKPTMETKTIGKREWFVVKARGSGKGTMKNWLAMERRIYITQFDRKMVYCSATVRTAAEQTEQDQLWKVVEDVCASLPPPAK